MLRRKNTLTECFSKAKKYYKDGEHDKARDYCDMGIAYIREKRSQGMQANELLENVRLDLWLERFWTAAASSPLIASTVYYVKCKCGGWFNHKKDCKHKE